MSILFDDAMISVIVDLCLYQFCFSFRLGKLNEDVKSVFSKQIVFHTGDISVNEIESIHSFM